MKISFCIICYNSEKYIQRSIDSVLNIVKNCEFEILIGDDGSTDNTLCLIKKYQEKYGDSIIKLYQMNRDDNETNVMHRISNNRLNIASHASGDYIMFLDGDDYYCDSNFLTKALSILESDKKIVAIAHQFEIVKKENTFIVNLNSKKDSYYSKIDYTKNKSWIHISAFVLRNILNKNNIEIIKKYKYFDDNIILYFFLQYGEIYYIPKLIFRYMQDDSTTWNKSTAVFQSIMNCICYDISLIYAPKLKRYLFARYVNSIRLIFHNRKKLKYLLEKSVYNTLLEDCILLNLNLSKNMLNYNNLTTFRKIKFLLTLLFYYIWRKF